MKEPRNTHIPIDTCNNILPFCCYGMRKNRTFFDLHWLIFRMWRDIPETNGWICWTTIITTQHSNPVANIVEWGFQRQENTFFAWPSTDFTRVVGISFDTDSSSIWLSSTCYERILGDLPSSCFLDMHLCGWSSENTPTQSTSLPSLESLTPIAKYVTHMRFQFSKLKCFAEKRNQGSRFTFLITDLSICNHTLISKNECRMFKSLDSRTVVKNTWFL